MFDLWGFLLQTLTASGVAVLLLAIKALFKDKLPPKWHFTVWGVLGVMLLIPAGLNGRYALLHWQVVVELIKGAFGEYSFSQVLFPVPVVTAIPKTITEWIFAIYVIGVIANALRYGVSYIRLRSVLSKGDVATDETVSQVERIAAQLKIKPCRIISVQGLPSAFVCGIIRPVLAVPANEVIDDKIILHELLHLKSKDTVWSVVICALRCLHWCNPLIVYCANKATNDMETRCDQYVLEQLEGEERREYGHILLSMVNERFAKTPGTTCVNNGGKHIKERIEAIARFKKYPKGMGLVSICVLALLTLSLVIGVQASTLYEGNGTSLLLPLASARSTYCTTPAGAFDTYAKSILDQNGLYRLMCAPVSEQKEIVDVLKERDRKGIYPTWDGGVDEWPDSQSGYFIYNLQQLENEIYEGLLVLKVSYPPNGQPEELGKIYLAVQNLRVQKENGRWVVIPLEDFKSVETISQSLAWGCVGVPGITYAGEANNFRIEVTYQTIHTVDSTVTNQHEVGLWSNSYFDTTAKPNAEFSDAVRSQSMNCIYVGDDSDKDSINHIAVSMAPVFQGESRPVQLRNPSQELSKPIGDMMSGGSNSGEQWISMKLKPGWDSTIPLDGGGGSVDPLKGIERPEYYAADLYINNEKVASIDLALQKEVTE